MSRLSMSRQALDALARRVARDLEQGAAQAASRRRARELSRALLAPLGPRLDAAERLAVVATGSLEGLPLDALPHPRTGQRLVFGPGLFYPSSLSVLGALRDKKSGCRAPPRPILAVGDPVFGADDPRWPRGLADVRERGDAWLLRRLPGSRREVASLVRRHGGGVTTLVGTDATRRRFLEEAPRHRLLHVATHGRSDPRQPRRHRLALSCVDETGRVTQACDLYADDLAGLDLCGQLVVLSACSSAAGPSLVGEGVLGLPRVFLEAGASAVVASAWDVEDAATATLMEIFHAFLAEGLAPVEALAAARRLLAGAGHGTSAWAPFVLLGDGVAPLLTEP